jgi:hypothetical protein
MTLHENIASIGNSAFSGCGNFNQITCLRESPPTTLGTDGFKNTHSDLVIKVPASALSAYKTAEKWNSDTILNKIFAIE